MSPRVSKGVTIAGWVLTILSVVAYCLIVYASGLDADAVQRRFEANGSFFGSGSPDWLLGSAGFVATIFCIGVALLGMGDLNRRRRAVTTVDGDYNPSGQTRIAYVVRPISVGWQLLWIAVLAVAYVFVYPVQFFVGFLQPHGSPNALLQALVTIPALAISATLGAVIVSLVKKVALPAALHHSASKLATMRTGGWRRFLHIWHGDLWIAAVGGVLAGLAVQPIATGHGGVGAGFLILGLVLIVTGGIFATQFWRTGERLGDIVIARPYGYSE